MKTFYYNITKSNRRTYGGRNETADIYTAKGGKIVKLGSCSWCTASYRGEKSEVFNALVILKQIPKKWLKSSVSEWSSGGYFQGDVLNHYQIKRLGE